MDVRSNGSVRGDSARSRNTDRVQRCVLVIGGCGFLGRHLVRLLAENGDRDGISEIRTLDIQEPPEELNQINFKIKVRHIKGDIRDASVVSGAAKGVTTVFHTASVVDTAIVQDGETMNIINVHGTKNIVQACIDNNVPILVYTSSSELVKGSKPVINHNEEDAEIFDENDLILGAYSTTKRTAEKLILSHNGSSLANGKPLRTIALRPCGIYGEADHTFVTAALKATKMCGGFLFKMGSSDVVMQKVYVGNTAWAHICAWRRTRQDSGVCGQAYLVTDDTAIDNNFKFFGLFVEARNWKVLPGFIPFFLVYYLVLLLELFIWLLSPLIRVTLPVSSREVVMACTTCYYDGSKARRRLGYEPLFNEKESLERSKKFYSTADI